MANNMPSFKYGSAYYTLRSDLKSLQNKRPSEIAAYAQGVFDLLTSAGSAVAGNIAQYFTEVKLSDELNSLLSQIADKGLTEEKFLQDVVGIRYKKNVLQLEPQDIKMCERHIADYVALPNLLIPTADLELPDNKDDPCDYSERYTYCVNHYGYSHWVQLLRDVGQNTFNGKYLNTYDMYITNPKLVRDFLIHIGKISQTWRFLNRVSKSSCVLFYKPET